jgi:hypothetical protein
LVFIHGNFLFNELFFHEIALNHIIFSFQLTLQLFKLRLKIPNQSMLGHLSIQRFLFLLKENIHFILPELYVFLQSILFTLIMQDFYWFHLMLKRCVQTNLEIIFMLHKINWVSLEFLIRKRFLLNYY